MRPDSPSRSDTFTLDLFTCAPFFVSCVLGGKAYVVPGRILICCSSRDSGLLVFECRRVLRRCPRKNLRKRRHATQRNTKPARGRAVSLTQIITTNLPPSENLIRCQANPKKTMPRSSPCGAITKLSHHMGSLKTTTPTSLGPQIPNRRLPQPPVRKS